MGLSKLVDDIVTDLLARPGGLFEICARLPASDDLLGSLRQSGADILLCMLPEEQMRSNWERALDELPPLAIVNLFDQERSARLHALRPQTVDVSGVDAAALIDLLSARAPQPEVCETSQRPR
ncbi:hypothetical protein [Nakamurella sp.]|uniref:hypothetical protein n=1 Tax=Nakamurella sp. TaxID=1869182 RepID=UPI003B3AD4E9